MAPHLTREDVLNVAALARLELSPDDVALFSRQLAGILEYADAVRQVDTSDVPPTSHALVAGPGWRDDRPAASLDRETSLGQAPDADRTAGLFRVPKVL